MKTVEIQTDFIKLDAFLKFSGACITGGHAKVVIADGDVFVNGEVCVQRGRKLHPGDVVAFEGDEYLVKEKE